MTSSEYVVMGQVVDGRGIAIKRSAAGNIESNHTLPPSGFLRQQPADIALLFGHDESWRIGSVQYLERGPGLGLLAVGTISAAAVAHLESESADGWYLSPGLLARRGPVDEYGRPQYDRGMLTEISVTRHPASLCTRLPIKWWAADSGGGRLPVAWYEVREHARAAVQGARYRSAPTPYLEIVGDVAPPAPVATAVTAPPVMTVPAPAVVPPPVHQRSRSGTDIERSYRHSTGGYITALDGKAV